MTIGIAVSGPAAGLAAFRALRAVEAVARGAIGGFVSFVVIDTEGNVLSAETQRGGTMVLFGGADPPSRLASARLAVLMSSGPDRPEPLAQFTPAHPSAGLLTGHRMPCMPVTDGRVPYEAALARLAAGGLPTEAVAEALALDPEADAGLIAMDLAGRIALGNSEAVARRDDLGEILAEDSPAGMRIAVLHNSIFPHHALAALAASAAFDVAMPLDRTDGEATLTAAPLELSNERQLHLNSAGEVRAIHVTEPAWLAAYWEGSAVRRGDPVIGHDGSLVGRVTREVYCVARNGRVIGGRGGACAGWSEIGEAAENLSGAASRR